MSSIVNSVNLEDFKIIDINILTNLSSIYYGAFQEDDEVIEETYGFNKFNRFDKTNSLQLLERKRKFLSIIKDKSILYTHNNNMNTLYRVCGIKDKKETIVVYWEKVKNNYEIPKDISIIRFIKVN